ncbi:MULTISPECIES: ParB-like protein [unclassified Xanthobacter]|uniref:ParB-like protein n=1 Tax=unclassified Xanthobacter TaxID=2623496 RepID=UPI001F2231A7|nr:MULTISPECIES: ParB-like protein [unclassified Xanthobacter]
MGQPREGEEIRIDLLHPTQLTLGLSEVKRRAKAMDALSKSELKALVAAKAIPHVLGPGGRIYMVDHHHLCRALQRIDENKAVLGTRVADWSDLDLHGFWQRMERESLCWPIDMDGNRRPCVKIPQNVKDLTDNPWRTLARGVRGRAYSNEDTPFQEFMWGNYYRSFMSNRLLEVDLELAEELAIKVSRLDEAQDLPGYLGSA